MAYKATHRQTDSSLAVPVVLFGVDDNGKPKAARFTDKHANLATKAAGHLKLQVLPIVDSAVVDLAGRLPAGRIHANGRGFVPYIRRDLYAKLVAAAGSPSWNASLWVRDIVAAWSLWSWSWSESLDPGKGWITEDIEGLEDPERRFASMGQFAAELRRCLRDLGSFDADRTFIAQPPRLPGLGPRPWRCAGRAPARWPAAGSATSGTPWAA